MYRDKYGYPVFGNKEEQKASVIFTQAVRGRNFVTPTVLDYYLIPNGALELSTGKGLDQPRMWGITVVENKKKNSAKSKPFYSHSEALVYIKELQNGQLEETKEESS